MLLDTKKQYKKILEFVEKNVDRIPLIKINKWVRERDIMEYMSKAGVSETTTKRRLQELVASKQLQTRLWGGRRFYAPPTVPVPLLSGIIFTSVLVVLYNVLVAYGLIGMIVIFLFPFFSGIATIVADKKLNNKGICIECGKSLRSGELYCDEHKKGNI